MPIERNSRGRNDKNDKNADSGIRDILWYSDWRSLYLRIGDVLW